MALEKQTTVDDPKMPFDRAVRVLRDGVADSYGARITPMANLLRVGADLFPDADRGSLKEGFYLEHSIWRYKLPPEKVRSQVTTAVERYDNSHQCNQDETLTTNQIETIIQVAGYRQRSSLDPYERSA